MVALKLGKLAKSFRFKPDQKLWKSPALTNVIAKGLTLAEFHQYEWAIKDYETRRAELQRKEALAQNLEEKVAEQQTTLAELSKSLGTSRAELEKLERTNSELHARIETLEARKKDIDSSLSSREQERRDIVKEIEKQERKLDELKNEVRLFPSEIVGFVKEGNRNIAFYSAIGFPFVVFLGIMLGSLFLSAVDLSQLWKREEGVEIWTIFLTRLPYVLLALAIIETCAYVIARLIFEVMRINRQRLELAKLSIIAKDVSIAAAAVSEIPAEDQYQEETKLRMQLLREHMANYPEQDFNYKGSAIMTAIISVAKKITNSKVASD